MGEDPTNMQNVFILFALITTFTNRTNISQYKHDPQNGAKKKWSTIIGSALETIANIIAYVTTPFVDCIKLRFTH